MSAEIIVTDTATEADRAVILDGLVAHGESRAGASQRRPLAVLVRDSGGKAVSGLWGRTAWRWLFIEILWLPEHLRGRGLGAELIRRAEEEAKRRGCIGAWLDSFDFQAGARYYEKLGYGVFGTIDDYPPGHYRSYMRKLL